MTSAAQKAAQNRLAAAAHQAKREGIKGKAFGRRVGEILRGTGGKIRSGGKKAGRAIASYSHSNAKGMGAYMRQARMSLDFTAPGAGVFVKEGDSRALRAKMSDAMQRYTGVGFDGSIDFGPVTNTGLTLATVLVDDKIKRARGHYQLIGTKHALPAIGEASPYLFAWDAISQPGLTARGKLQAAYRCIVETQSSYDPITGEYKGLSSDKFKAYMAGSHIGREASKILSAHAPGVQKAVREFIGWSL